jgi:hypothetical protein
MEAFSCSSLLSFCEKTAAKRISVAIRARLYPKKKVADDSTTFFIMINFSK